MDHSVILVDGNKYMWDGKTYDNESAAKERMAQYQKDKFLTMLKKEGNEYRNYTRRVVKKTVLEGGGSP